MREGRLFLRACKVCAGFTTPRRKVWPSRSWGREEAAVPVRCLERVPHLAGGQVKRPRGAAGWALRTCPRSHRPAAGGGR